MEFELGADSAEWASLIYKGPKKIRNSPGQPPGRGAARAKKKGPKKKPYIKNPRGAQRRAGGRQWGGPGGSAEFPWAPRGFLGRPMALAAFQRARPLAPGRLPARKKKTRSIFHSPLRATKGKFFAPGLLFVRGLRGLKCRTK